MRLSLSIALLALLVTDAGASDSDAALPLTVDSPLIRRISARKLTARSRKVDVTSSRLLSTQSRPNFLHGHRRFHTPSSEANRDSPDDNWPLSSNKKKRQTQSQSQESCDSAFINCLSHEKCLLCFATMQQNDVDWASVKPETPCSDVLSFLNDSGKCNELKNDQAEKDVFCNTFSNCVIWDDDDKNKGKTADGNGEAEADDDFIVDCDALTECNWDGFHSGFLGDGICHDAVPGCYNHAICKYDGGDCCENTCYLESLYVECGLEGFACRDPNSSDCDTSLSTMCLYFPSEEDDDYDLNECEAENEVPYRLIQYDTWGDGWDDTKMTIMSDADAIIYKGGLDTGTEGTEYICLSTEEECYHVTVSGGIWGNEISWEIKPLQHGAPAIADGGSPQDCTFAIRGDICEKTCDGRPHKDMQDSPGYTRYKDMLGCIKKKCIIQVGACDKDVGCQPCMNETPLLSCYSNDNYNALIDCTLCKCQTDDEDKDVDIPLDEYCQEKEASGAKPQNPKKEAAAKNKTGVSQICNAAQTLHGSGAVMEFAQCSSVDSVSAMITDYDENNFGALDSFEACAHSFKNDVMHGGKKAIDCMRILYNSQSSPGVSEDTVAPVDDIKSLSKNLYNNAESFCTCAAEAAKESPLCKSFMHFKTLLYETLDACKALDEIDCDAWNEFYDPCKTNLVEKFEMIDFNNPNQCEYVSNGCGHVGPFPAFRKLDCGKTETPKQAWDFFIEYDRACLGGSTSGGDRDSPTKTTPVSPPSAAPKGEAGAGAGSTPHEDASEPVPAAPTSPKKYVPPPDDEDKSTPASDYNPPTYPSDVKPKKKRHVFAWFLILCTAGGAFLYHKRRSNSFDFVRYRRPRNWGNESGMMSGMMGGESEVYSGFNGNMGESSFEPPSLPPTPSAYGDNS